MGKVYFGSDLVGRFVLIVGFGGMGGAQLFVAMMVGAVFLGIEVDLVWIWWWLEMCYCDKMMYDFDEVLVWVFGVKEWKEVLSVGLVGNVVELFFEIHCCGIVLDLVTD